MFALARKIEMPRDTIINGRDPGPRAPAATRLLLPHTKGRFQSDTNADPEAETIRGSVARAAALRVRPHLLRVPVRAKERIRFLNKIQT